MKLALVLLCALLLPCQAADQEATGFVHVKQLDGVWWFIGPDGERFVSLGVNHIEPHLWLAPYNKDTTLARYGRDLLVNDRFNTHGIAARKWIDQQLKHCEELHFNTFGKHTHGTIDPKLYRDEIYYVASLNTAPLAGWRERNGEGPRPDVFSADFEAFLEERVAAICQQHRNSRNLLGYLYTDVPSWVMGRKDQKAKNEYTLIYPWVNALLALGEASPGKQRWLELLKARHRTAEEAAKVWGLPVSPTYGIDWQKIARITDWSRSIDKQKANADLVAFLHLIADRWYGLHREIILKHDPNHLLLGDKNMVNWHYDWVIPALKKHVDVIAIQAYGRWEDDRKTTDMLYEQIGKPIFNGDGCHAFAQPNQQKFGVKGFRTNAKSIKEVAQLYRETLEGMMATPYVIGWHHCGYLQQWDTAERGDSPRNENGFMDPFEKHLTIWTEVIKATNAEAAALHEVSNKN